MTGEKRRKREVSQSVRIRSVTITGRRRSEQKPGAGRYLPVSYADKNGYVYDASGTCIGVNETYRYVYDPDALG